MKLREGRRESSQRVVGDVEFLEDVKVGEFFGEGGELAGGDV